MIDERDLIAARRKSHVTEIAGRLAQECTWRRLESILVVHAMDHSETAAIRFPIHVGDVFHDLPIGVADLWRSSKRSRSEQIKLPQRIEGNRELAGWGD